MLKMLNLFWKRIISQKKKKKETKVYLIIVSSMITALNRMESTDHPTTELVTPFPGRKNQGAYMYEVHVAVILAFSPDSDADAVNYVLLCSYFYSPWRAPIFNSS